jgi:glycosyltransferase involved in cell wall biosynthesis
MSETQLEGTLDTDDSRYDTPAVGLIATEHNSEALVREVLRAMRQGYQVVIAHPNIPGAESVQFAQELGAHVVRIERSEPEMEYLTDTLAEVARSLGYPGVILHSDPAQRAAFERSSGLLQKRDEFVVEALTNHDSLPYAPELCVGIPAYNEAETIGDVVESAREYAECVLVVDDGSTDDTVGRARNAGATVVEHNTNRGYGAALKTVFSEAAAIDAQRLVILDADGQHDPAEIPDLVETQERTESDLVIGSRFTADGDTDAPLYRRFGLAVVNVLTNLSLGVVRPRSWIHDTQSGFRLYSQPAIQSLAEDGHIGDRMHASTDILYHAHHHNFRIEEAGAEVDYDVDGASNLNPISHGITLVMNILRTVERDRPVTVLGIPGFVSVLVGIGFGYWTFTNYISTGTFPLGLAVTATFFALAGVFASFTAIILHALNTHLGSLE